MTILTDHPVVLLAVVFTALVLMVEIGYRMALRTSTNSSEALQEQIVAARDGIGLLLSLLLAFTLQMVLTRYDLRKQLIVDEANAIGDTRLRAQLLAEPARSKIQELMQEYLDARIAFSEAGPDDEKLEASFFLARRLQNEIWQQTVTVAEKNPAPIYSIFVDSLNESTDLSEKRLAALENRIPGIFYVALIFISMLTCLLTGYGIRQRALIVISLWPLMISIVLALIADLDSSHAGLILIGQQSIERLR